MRRLDSRTNSYSFSLFYLFHLIFFFLHLFHSCSTDRWPNLFSEIPFFSLTFRRLSLKALVLMSWVSIQICDLDNRCIIICSCFLSFYLLFLFLSFEINLWKHPSRGLIFLYLSYLHHSSIAFSFFSLSHNRENFS